MLPQSERLEFRRWRREDGDLASSLWRNSEVMRFLGGPYGERQVTERLDRELANDAAYGVQYWPLFVRSDGRFAGCCGLKPYEPENLRFEIGFHFLPQFWGCGYAREAAQAVIAYAFEEREFAALYAGHHPENGASNGLLQRLGFTCIGTHFFAPTGLQHPWYELASQ